MRYWPVISFSCTLGSRFPVSSTGAASQSLLCPPGSHICALFQRIGISALGASPTGAVGSATGATSSGTRCAAPSARCGPLPGEGAAAREACWGSRGTEGGGVRPEGAEAQSCAAAGHLAGARGAPLWGSSHCREAEAATETLPGDGHSQQCALQRALGLLMGGRTEEGEAARTR